METSGSVQTLSIMNGSISHHRNTSGNHRQEVSRCWTKRHLYRIGVIAEGSVSGVLEGKRYNRAVRFHKLLYESLMRAAWPRFQTWLVENHANRKRAANDDVKLLCDGISESKVHEQLGKASFSELQELFHLCLDFLRHNNGKLFTFWMSYFDLVEILLSLLRASREGNWALHLSSIRQMIPWCFAYDNLNYARYFPQRVFSFIFSFISL